MKQEKHGVLLVNLGTPDAPTSSAVKRYLKEFLSDPRVIEIPAIVWQVILRGIILNTRPSKSAEAYSKVWMKDGSPLLVITRDQAAGLQQRLGDGVIVRHAMRYGQPSIPSQLEALHKDGCDRILLAPLYPQYSAATTATAIDKAAETLGRMRWQPALRTLPPYHDDPVYIDSVVASMKKELAKLTFEPEVILVSFHGVPKEYLLKGDPYHCQCVKTWRLMREAFGWPADKFRMSFQSRFGKAEWLQPYTDKTVEALAESGVKRMAIVAPGFSADCLETLEELDGDGFDGDGFDDVGRPRSRRRSAVLRVLLAAVVLAVVVLAAGGLWLRSKLDPSGPPGEAVRVEDLERVGLLAGPEELHRNTGDRADREGRAPPGVAVDLGHDEARHRHRGSERLRDRDRLLAGHCVDHEQRLDGVHRLLDGRDLAHQRLVDRPDHDGRQHDATPHAAQRHVIFP